LKEWERICAEAKLPLDYTPNKAYDDQVLIDLVLAASKVCLSSVINPANLKLIAE